MKRMLIPRCRRLASTLVGLTLASTAAATDYCGHPVAGDDVSCRELILEYDPGFDLGAFNALYGTVLSVDVPDLGVLSLLAADEADRNRIKLAVETVGFPGVIEADFNSKLLSPECRQLSIGLVELGHFPLDLSTQPAMAVIGASAAWLLGDGSGALVAVADTGVDATHPVLAAALTADGLDLVDGDLDPDDSANGIDDDGDTVTDPGYGHGTSVASLVVAVAPGVQIYPIRIADDECRTTAMHVIAAIVEAANRGAQVINLSFGMSDANKWLGKSMRYARDHGLLVVTSAGNGSTTPAEYPGRDGEAVTVTAVTDLGVKADFANWDSAVDLVAPGINLLGAYPADRYARQTGTSFATALVSGVAALAFGQTPCAPARNIDRLLADTANSVDSIPGNDPWRGDLGAGMIDAMGAMAVPGATLEPIPQILVAKAAPDRVSVSWAPTGRPGVGMAVRINSVVGRGEIAHASINTDLCPSCPAPSIVARCEAAEAGGVCAESVPGLLVDPEPLLYLQAVAACGAVEGPLF